MIIYNVTVAIEPQREEEFVLWLKETHLPEVMETGCFEGYELFRVLNSLDNANPTYAIQYRLSKLKNMQEYESKHAKRLREETLKAFGESVQPFRTMLEKLD